MRTRSSSNLVGNSSSNPTTSNPRRRNRRRSNQRVEPFALEESPVVTMADQRTMAELLRAPTEGYAEAIVVPPILVEHFELKHSLINMMTSDQFFRLEKDNPHDHIRWFNKITSTIKYKDVPNSTIKLMLFPFSLAGAARRWLEKEPPRFILTWEDLFDESFHEAWDRYKDLLHACPHHGFTKLHQLDTFYNALNPADQDSLNSTAGGNLLERSTQDVLTIIKNKSKVRNSRNKLVVSQVKSSDGNSSSSDIAKLTHAVNQQTSDVTTAMTAILKQFQATPPPASVKAVEEICVTCGGAHPYYQCLAADGNTFLEYRDNTQGYVSATAGNYNQGNSGYRPPGMANQTRPPDFIQQNGQNNQNRFSQPQGYNQGNNFNQNITYQAPIQQNQSNTVANSKGELKAITTRSGLVLDGPTVPMPPPFINPRRRRVEETLTDLEHGITRDVFVSVGKFTFSADFVIVNYESDPRVPLILGRPFLQTARALIDVHGEEMILRDGNCDSVFYEDFFVVDALPSTNNEDKVFNPGILIHESHFEATNCVTPEKNVKKISYASLILEDFNPPLYKHPFHKEVPWLGALLSFSSKNEENVFNPGILTSKGVHTSLLP
ncbi:reverse transcriptase domain-containing protein [Tanacetum coccineum]